MSGKKLNYAFWQYDIDVVPHTCPVWSKDTREKRTILELGIFSFHEVAPGKFFSYIELSSTLSPCSFLNFIMNRSHEASGTHLTSLGAGKHRS